jgi:hypothetical protein
MSGRTRVWIAVIAALLFAGLVRARLLEMPLERDEGEYAYPAQLLLDGVPPYREAYGMKMPGILGAYALVLATFGETRAGIHLGLLVVNAASAWLVLLLGRRLLDPVAGATAAIVLLLLTLHPGVHGLAANTEHFVILPALAGLWLVVRGGDTRRLASIAVGGACLGLAFLTKQTALFWVLFGALVALADDRRRRPRGAPVGLVAFAAGAAVPVVATGLALLAAGVFESFWYWTVRYPLHYAAAAPLHQVALELRGALPSVVGATLPCWLLAGIGLVIALARRRALGRPGFLPGWLLCAGLSVAVGMRFRPQHFLLLTPVLALLAGLAVSRIGEQVVRRGPRALAGVVQVALVAVAVASFAWGERRILFTAPPMEAARLVYGTNPFPESIEVARFLREHTAPDETIAVLGSEPQIYFYAKRRSASPYILTYPLMQPGERALSMQREMIRALDRARPRYLVFVNAKASWQQREDSPGEIFAWHRSQTRGAYQRVGWVHIPPDGKTEVRWGEQAAGPPPTGGTGIAVWRRRDGGP